MRLNFCTFLHLFSFIADHATEGGNSNPQPDSKHAPDAGGSRGTRRTPRLHRTSVAVMDLKNTPEANVAGVQSTRVVSRLRVAAVRAFTVLAAPAIVQCSSDTGQPQVVAEQPQTFAAGGDGTCMVSTSGDLHCWSNESNLRTILEGSVRAIAISGGTASPAKCAVLTNGGVRCWGSNLAGQLGIGPGHTDDFFWSPPWTDVLTDATAVVLGYAHTCALLSGGRVRCWGNNSAGQLGTGTAGEPVLSPPSKDVLSGVSAITAGDYHTCALLSSGAVRCWGSGHSGELGDGKDYRDNLNGHYSATPTKDVLVGVKQISAGGNHTCALMSSGGVRCWGSNNYGELGDGSRFGGRSTPTKDVVTNAIAVAAGATFTCALLANGGVRCWGDNRSGQLGDGTNISRATPPATDVLTGATAITAGGGSGYDHACALLSDGRVSCWGWQYLDENRPTPVTVEPLNR